MRLGCREAGIEARSVHNLALSLPAHACPRLRGKGVRWTLFLANSILSLQKEKTSPVNLAVPSSRPLPNPASTSTTPFTTLSEK